MKKILLAMVASWLALSASHALAQTYETFAALNLVVDSNAADGFDFAEAYTTNCLFEFTVGESVLESNQLVDGGSRTTYSGISLTELSFDFGQIEILDRPVAGEFVYWDRADFAQHVLELNFLLGDSSVSVIYTADQNNADAAFGELFTPASPRPNFGELNPTEFSGSFQANQLFTNPQIVIEAGANVFGGAGMYVGDLEFQDREVLLGDVNLDNAVNLLDVQPFIDVLLSGVYQEEADINL